MTSDPNVGAVGFAQAGSWKSIRKTMRYLLVMLLATLFAAGSVQAASLQGSKSSLREQNRQARAHDYSFLRTATQVRQFAEKGYLVPVRSNANLQLANVSYPYARPEVDLFLNRLGSQFRSACGEPLVVTSLTRPTSRQPRNASPLSVHPTGMAMDLRMPSNKRCRSWLERTLLSLEKSGVLEATKERRPPHYHVALYPTRYTKHVERITGATPRLKGRTVSSSSAPTRSGSRATYVVRRGDTLWDIARKHRTSVGSIKSANNMRSAMIKPGQKLQIP